MPSYSFRLGVAKVAVYDNDSSSLPSLASTTVTTTAVAATTNFHNSIRTVLPAGSYKVLIAPVGRDVTNGGYTIGVSTAVAMSATAPTAGQSIQSVIALAAVQAATNLTKTPVLGVFLGLGASPSQYQLVDFAPLQTGYSFVHHVTHKPLLSVPLIDEAVLTAATASDYLGDRAPLGYSATDYSPTTGGVQVTRSVDSLEIDSDTGVRFPVAITRSTEVDFALLSNDMLDIVRAGGGEYVKYTESSVVREEAFQSLATAVAKLQGNRPFRLILPVDGAGYQEVRTYLGGLTTNQVQTTESWTKNAPTTIAYKFSTAIQDKLLVDQHCEVISKIRA